MTTHLIDGRQLAKQTLATVADGVAELRRPPGLATVLVGDDPASSIYVSNKRKSCMQVGIRDHHRSCPESITADQLAAVIDELNADPRVDGILLQLPLPGHLDARALIDRIDPDKDVDGLTEVNAGRLGLGRPGLRPCTPTGVVDLLDWAEIPIAGAHAVVVGRSDLVGRPQAQMLLARDATVTICHSRTRDLVEITRQADILIAAAGVPKLIGRDHVRPGAAVIDVGIHRTETGLCGDVDAEAVHGIASHLTPVPGGVGPMTIASLMLNTLRSAQMRQSS